MHFFFFFGFVLDEALSPSFHRFISRRSSKKAWKWKTFHVPQINKTGKSIVFYHASNFVLRSRRFFEKFQRKDGLRFFAITLQTVYREETISPQIIRYPTYIQVFLNIFFWHTFIKYIYFPQISRMHVAGLHGLYYIFKVCPAKMEASVLTHSFFLFSVKKRRYNTDSVQTNKWCLLSSTKFVVWTSYRNADTVSGSAS